MGMKNSDKIILDLCGGTGAWNRPYAEAGYDVRIITWPGWDVEKVTFYEECMVFTPTKSGPEVQRIEYKSVYGILVAPPCTEFSRAKSTKPRKFKEGMEIIQACLQIVWRVQYDHKLAFWVLENPMGLLRRFLGRLVVMVQPWWYGDLHTKETDLWGWFETPKRTVRNCPLFVERTYHNKNSKHFSSPKKPAEYAHLKLSRGDIRAITSPGFAKAFFKANQ